MSTSRGSARDVPGPEDSSADDGASFDRNLVVVATPYEGAERGASFALIREACAGLGLRAHRLEQGPGAGVTLRQIADLVRRAEFLVFDVSRCQSHVYYALGYAHGVGNEAADILLIAQEGSEPDFELLPARVRSYRSVEHVRTILADSLREMMSHTRG